MFIGTLLPTMRAAWWPRQGMPAAPARSPSRGPALADHAMVSAGQVSIEEQVRTAVGAVSRLAQNRGVHLEFAAADDLWIRADQDALHACLGTLLHDAIRRADTAILVTAARQEGGIAIAVLDDGPAAAPGDAWPDPVLAVPDGATVTSTVAPGRGTTVVLLLPKAA